MWGKISVHSSEVSTGLGAFPVKGYSFGSRGIPTKQVDREFCALPMGQTHVLQLQGFGKSHPYVLLRLHHDPSIRKCYQEEQDMNEGHWSVSPWVSHVGWVQ